MPEVTIPLAGNPTRRAYANATSTKGQRFVAAFFEDAPSPLTQEKPIFVSKRCGLFTVSTPSAGNIGNLVYYSPGINEGYAGFGTTNSTIFDDSANNLGTITGLVAHFSEVVISGVIHIMIASSDGTGWYYANGAKTNKNYTADGNNSTTITDIKISGVNSVSGLYVGQKLTAASNIVAGSRIVSIDSAAFTAVLDTATTGGAFNDLAITKEPVAKIIDSDFPTDIVGMFASLNGYTYIMDDDGNIYNSDLNSVISWNPSNIALASAYSDPGRGVARYKKMILGFGSNSVEFFQHSSNSILGSPLMRLQDSISAVGLKQGGVGRRGLYGVGHDRVFWIGNDFNFYTLDGLSAKRLNESPFSSSIIFDAVMPFTLGLKRFVSLTETSANGGQWYDIDSGMFTYSGFTDATFISGPNTAGISFAVTGGTSGKFFTFEGGNLTFQDNGSAYTMTIQTQRLALNGGKGFTANSIALIADKQASGTATLESSDDDYGTFRTLGTYDLTSDKMEIHRCGFYKSHAIFRLTHSANTAFRAQSLVADIAPAAT